MASTLSVGTYLEANAPSPSGYSVAVAIATPSGNSWARMGWPGASEKTA
jgi:hypothetical protein